MAKYKFNIIDNLGEIVEISEDTYKTYEDAEYDAQQWISDYSAGADVLALAGEEYGDPDDVDYEVYEV